MKKRIGILIVLAVCSLSFAQSVGWSTGYYAGWAQRGYPATEIQWKSYTHMCHFSVTPNDNGEVEMDMGLDDRTCKEFVAEAHQNGVKAIICCGGAGTGDRFINAAQTADSRAKLISSLISFMQQYGYDGVDMDWEEVKGNDQQYLALHKELREALDKITPRPIVTAAVAGWIFNQTTSQVWQYMDQLNNMSYWSRILADDGSIDTRPIARDMQELVDLGIPKEKLGVGIGLDYQEGNPEVDCDPRACAAKCQFAIDEGYGGVMVWAIEKDAKLFNGETPCHDTIATYLPAPSAVKSYGKLAARASVLSVLNGQNSARIIQYNVPSGKSTAAALVNLGLYDARGVLMARLVHGYQNPGTYRIQLDTRLNSAAGLTSGAYFVRFTANDLMETKSLLIAR
jgi:coenzyme F420-reducing hydrogenase delta subunit